MGYHRPSTSFGSYAFGISISIDVEKILRVAEWGRRREKLASDQFGDFGRDPPGDLATQSFKQLVGDPIHYFIDDALRNDHALLRFVRNSACGRLGLGAVSDGVSVHDLPHDMYGCGIRENVIQFQYVVHIYVLYYFDFTGG